MGLGKFDGIFDGCPAFVFDVRVCIVFRSRQHSKKNQGGNIWQQMFKY